MTKDTAINHIENLYPIDSCYPNTSEIGEKLLAHAINETCGWRELPEEVLIKYAELSLSREC